MRYDARMEKLYYLGLKALIRNAAGEILLLEVTKPDGRTYWDFPGGRINRGEDIETALKREVQEETGIAGVTLGECVGTELTAIEIPVAGDHDRGLILSVYVCDVSDIPKITTEANMRAEWCEPGEAVARSTKFSDSMKQHILKALGAFA